ncbi:MAG: DUF6106 family protein [Velocimicrobium sp.]
MEQSYTEASCRPKKSASDFLKIVGIFLVAIVCIGLLLFSGQVILQIIGAAGIVAIIYFYPRLNYEYEYIYCDGQIDFDKIMGGSKRKTIFKMDMDEMEICGSIKTAELAAFKDLKTKDFSSGLNDAKTYALIARLNNERVRVLFNPSEKMVELMWRKSPRKVLKY